MEMRQIFSFFFPQLSPTLQTLPSVPAQAFHKWQPGDMLFPTCTQPETGFTPCSTFLSLGLLN